MNLPNVTRSLSLLTIDLELEPRPFACLLVYYTNRFFELCNMEPTTWVLLTSLFIMISMWESWAVSSPFPDSTFVEASVLSA